MRVDIIFIVVLVCISCGLQLASEVEIDLDIPWPSGIVIDRVVSSHNKDHEEIYRFGRLQFNAVSFRPQWKSVIVVDNVLLADDAAAVIEHTEDYASEFGWSKNRHIDYGIRPTKDLPVRNIFETNDDYQAFIEDLQSKIWPAFASQFGINSSLLRIDDLFITKYSSDSSTENALAPHLDKSPWSFVVALNDDFEGGGTHFVDSRSQWRAPLGSALLFNGKQLHGAIPVLSGSRYIMAGFCDYGLADAIGPLAHEHFLSLYQPEYDGLAAQHGFRTGDLIVGIETCSMDEEDQPHHNQLIHREMTWIGTENITDSQWLHIVQSCEQLDAGGHTRIRVRRKI